MYVNVNICVYTHTRVIHVRPITVAGCLRHVVSSSAQVMGSYVPIPFEALLSIRVSSVYMLSCVVSIASS
jgi:hypothetical protein